MSSIYDRLRAQQAGAGSDAPDVVVAPVPVPAPTQAAAQPSIYDRLRAAKNGGTASIYDRLRSASSELAPGENAGKFVGRVLSDPNNSPEARALDALGFDATTRRQIQEDPVDALVGDISKEDLATYGVPAAALATGLALPALGAAGTLAVGVLGGAGARAGTAALKDEDPLRAAIDPAGVALDTVLSGVPYWAPYAGKAAKYGWEHLPSGVRDTATDAVGWTAEKAGNVARSLLRSYAEGTPTERLVRRLRGIGGGAAEALPEEVVPRSRVELQPVLEGHNIHDPSGGEFSYQFTFDGKPAGTIGAHDNGGKDVLIDWFDVDPSMQGTPGLTSAVRRAFLAEHPEFETYSAMRTGGAAGGRVIDRRPIGAIPSPPRVSEPTRTIPLAGPRRIIEDRPITIDDLAGNGRPMLQATGADAPPPGTPTRVYEGLGDTYAKYTAGEIRRLRQLGRDDLADQIEFANNYERRLRNWFDPQTDAASEPFATLPPAEGGDLSSRVVDVIEGGPPIEGTSQGAQAQRFADMLQNPDRYDPRLRSLAQPIQDELGQLGELGQRADVYDELKGAGARQRAVDLYDQGVDIAPIGGPPDNPERLYAQRQLVEDGRYYPRQPVPDPMAPNISEQTAIERIAERDPELSHRQAMRQLGGLRASATAGKARVLEEGTTYNKYAPDVLRTHIQADVPRIANAQAFGGRPVKIRVALPGGGAQDMIVGEHAAAQLEDLFNRRDMKVYDAYVGALQERYAPPINTDAGTSMLQSAASRMALPRAFITQIGQMPTGAIMAGGLKNVARGAVMVEENPVLRDVFRIGAQSHEFTDYAALATGSSAAQHSAPYMKPMENFLRGPGSYAAVPEIHDVAQESARMLEANQPFSRALVKRASEMGTTPEALGTEFISTDGTLSHRTWIDTVQHLANRWQHVQKTGEIPAWMRTQGGATAAQFKTFGLKQSQLIYDDILQPIIEGIRSGDKSLRDLGLSRLGRLGTLGVPANMTAAGLRTLATGKLPVLENVVRAGLTGPTGVAGDIAYGSGAAVVDSRHGRNPLGQLSEIPSVGVVTDTLTGLLGAAHDPGGAVEAAARLGGAYDTRIPLYATPAINVTREFFSSK